MNGVPGGGLTGMGRDYKRTGRQEQPSAEGPQIKRVKLTTILEPLGTADGIVTIPLFEVEDPEEDADLWEETEETLTGIRNGIPNEETVEAGMIAWVISYFGGWFVIQVQVVCE